MLDLLEPPPQIASKSILNVPKIVPVPRLTETATYPPKWFTDLSKQQKTQITWKNVAELKVHSACNFLSFNVRAYATILDSIRKSGAVLFPLAIAQDGRVIDGRYRLQAAKESGIAMVPVIEIDLVGNDLVRWIFEVKDSREHLSELERAVLAVQYQRKLRGDHIKVRIAAMNSARAGNNLVKLKKSIKKDSRKEACKKFKVPERTFRAIKGVADHRPDLFEKIISGELDAAAAIKQKGKNIDAARVEKAKELNAQPATLVNVELENNIHAGDAVETMKRIDDGVASLILFSPHYHGVNIEYDPPLPPQSYSEYLDYQQELLVESLRVSRRGGRLAIVLDTVRNHEDQRNYMLPVVADMTHLAIQCGWSFFNDIAWLKDEISGSKTNFGSLASCSAPIINRNHETILLFFRDTNKLDGDIALCDLSREEHLAWWTSAWHIKPELNRAIRDAHKAPFPEEIPHRLIKLLTYGKDLVIDPYNGSGTTTAVAARLGRRYIGVDRSQNYCAFARQRITSRHIIETVAIDVPLESSIADLCTFTSHGS